MKLYAAIIPTALRRLWANRRLAFCALAALTLAVALATAIPIYADGAGLRLLNAQLERREQQSGRPAFAMLIRYLSSAAEPLEIERISPANDLIAAALDRLGLPISGYGRHIRTAAMPLALGASERPALDVALGFVSGLDDQIALLEGAAPQPASDLSAPLEVLASRALVERIGLNVGDTVEVIGRRDGRATAITLRIAGVWVPRNERDPAWFYQPAAFDEVLLLPEASFNGPLAAALDDEVAQALWFARLDGGQLRASDAAALAGRVDRLAAEVAAALPGTRLEQSPAEALAGFRRDSLALSGQLAIFGAPLLGLVFFFVALVSGLMLRRQSGEIALLKTRGVTDGQIGALIGLEWLLLGAAALLLGPPLGLFCAGLIARSSSFLRFDLDPAGLNLALMPAHLLFGAAVLIPALLTVAIPAGAAMRRTLVDEQRQAARPERPPLWRRIWLDLLIVPLPLYGIYQLRSGDGLLLGASAGGNLSANPLLVLIPALLSASLGLLLLRLLPLLLTLAAAVAAHPNWIAPLVALRTLARQPQGYSGPLLLLILTLSLAIFSAAAAASLDDATERSLTYQVAADAQLITTGESTETAGSDGRPQQRDIREEPRWLFVPPSAYLEIPGVQAVSRVGRYTARLNSGTNAQLIGVDRYSLPQIVNAFDPTWADGVSLGELMNRLAMQPNGAIVSHELVERGFTIGSSITVRAELFGDQRDITLEIVGVLTRFPGFYPQDGPLLISNLDSIFDQMGGQYPHDIWLDYAAEADSTAIAAQVRALGVDLVDVRDRNDLLLREQSRPQRQGLFGLLSIGFVAASAITVLGFLAATAINAQRRAQELGVLRALGMSGGSAAAALMIEQGVLLIAGLLGGGGIGALCVLAVVPALQIGVGPYPGTPPTTPQIAFGDMALAAGLLIGSVLLALIGLAIAQRRAKLFTVVKIA